jgi:hypothetical protein
MALPAIATPTTKGSSWLNVSMDAQVSLRKQRLMLAPSSDDSGGDRRVFEKPFRGVLIIMPIAHLSVRERFRLVEVSISSFMSGSDPSAHWSPANGKSGEPAYPEAARLALAGAGTKSDKSIPLL